MTTTVTTQALADAFDAFTRMSVQLEQSYRDLEQRVTQLNTELNGARSERQQELAEKEQLADRLQAIIEALPVGVLVLDGEERVHECNRAAREQLGEPLVGEHWHAVSSRAFVSLTGHATEVSLHDGRRLNIAGCVLDNETGRLLVLHDVTETHALQELVTRQQRLGAMGEMAASLAHQIRTPLSAAVLYGSHLSKDELPAGDRSRFSGRLIERLRHLERMVNDMLSFARGGSGGEDLFSVDDLLDELHQAMESQLQSAGARWQRGSCVPNARIRGNKDALLGALGNLVTNSLQATTTTPLLEVTTTSTSSGDIEIHLRDNGPGIPAESLERIFEPFFTTRPGGTGLGLAVVQATVRAHHGSIQVKSPITGGTEFVLRLPDAAASTGLLSGSRQSYFTTSPDNIKAVCGFN